MSGATTIEWTDASWNPLRGCAKVSEGCRNCYAMRQAHRSSGAGGAYEGLTEIINGRPQWNGLVRTVPELLDQPLHWKKPRRIFVNSMSDLFHESVPIEFIGSVLGIAAAAEWHTFQVLTKRPERMQRVLESAEFRDVFEDSNDMHTHTEHLWPPHNVWLGVSIEDQATADERIPVLLRTPAAVRFISAEPLLGPVDFTLIEDWLPARKGDGGADEIGPAIDAIDWVIAGGESGPGARPSHPDWFRSLRDQCAAAGVAFFFKQWGAWAPPVVASHEHSKPTHVFVDGKEVGPEYVIRLGKKAAGRLLDGRTHDEYPR